MFEMRNESEAVFMIIDTGWYRGLGEESRELQRLERGAF